MGRNMKDGVKPLDKRTDKDGIEGADKSPKKTKYLMLGDYALIHRRLRESRKESSIETATPINTVRCCGERDGEGCCDGRDSKVISREDLLEESDKNSCGNSICDFCRECNGERKE
jgi:hypothetical protein